MYGPIAPFSRVARRRRIHRLLLIAMVVTVGATLFPAAPTLALSPEAAEKQRIKDLCRQQGLEIVHETSAQCSHGEDPAPPGKDIKRDIKPVVLAPTGESGAAAGKLTPGAPTFACDGDGTTGFRTQVIYVRAADKADRYAAYKASFLQWAWEADQIYRSSAQDTGGLRRIRFVHDSTCTPSVLNLTLSASGDDNLNNTINQLQELGFERSDRKYMIFMDANVLCGVGTMVADDRPGQENWNNQGPDYARIDAGCWSGDIAAHEHMHTMGGVQNSAPHGSGGNHCTDEYDVMCYSDSPNYPPMQIACSTTSRDWSRFDCNNDDYFHTNPPAGSYLATKWNTANNRFLASDAGGSTPVATCPDQALEPDESSGAARALALGAATSRAFCGPADQDWMYFQTAANQRYRVEILSKAPAITPAIEVVAGNGKKLLASNFPPAGGLAVVEFRTRTGGAHYVKVRNTPETYPAADTNVYSIKVSDASPTGGAVGGMGYNAYGQLGGGTLEAIRTTPSVSFNTGSVQVAGGLLHSAAVMSNGTVRTWGWNSFGQLGNGTAVDSTVQVQPVGLNGVASVSAGYLHTIALKKDGTVWAWGWNGIGQLGDGTLTDRSVPVKVAGLTDIVEVSAGWFHNLALKRDGTVWVWGYNGQSQLGDGTALDRRVPVKLSLTNVTAVSAGSYHSLTALEDGTARAWGYNGQGQLGDGTRFSRTVPTAVRFLTNVYRVAAGWTHSVALRNDGSVLAWGYNAQQQAGATLSYPDRPLVGAVTCGTNSACPKVSATGTLGKIEWISAGSSLHNLALAEDGTVWSWGWNVLGQLGDGSLVDSHAAVKAIGVTATDIAAGSYHSLYNT
jgi:alpha-tubulin suppressor-like RCC1 family protein